MFSAFLLVLCCQCLCLKAQETPEVVELQHEKFSAFISENPFAVVLFCCSRCENCEEATKIYHKATKRVRKENFTFPMVKLTSGLYKFVDEWLCVKDPPLLRVYREGQVVSEYTQPIEKVADIIGWLRKQDCLTTMNTAASAHVESSPGTAVHVSVEELTDETFSNFLGHYPNSLIRLYSDQLDDPKQKAAFDQVGLYANMYPKAPRLAHLNTSNSPQAARRLIVKTLPTVVILISKQVVKECSDSFSPQRILDCFQTVNAVLNPETAAREYANSNSGEDAKRG